MAQQSSAPLSAQTAMQDVAVNQPERPQVGERISPENLHRISRPGLYGISKSPDGSDYGVLEGRLIRYDPHTMQVQSIIREVDQILD
ncbi:hypothetical protein [Paracoccus laeviglucosivorans]|uniref:hypothetical protein n=1 Tax=Paracoccus laeviglucosivorans TaxID=1197861 RepID=UPI001157801B|nr:hypothetical protein [Paracoccus laeviglucosivorans]